MTTPPTTPAPMSAERLEEAREFLEPSDKDHEHDFEERAVGYVRDLLADRDALTARIAELERDRAGQQAETVREIGKNVPLRQEISRLQTELAAARKSPEDGELAETVGFLREYGDARARDGWHGTKIRLYEAALFLTRQAAALKEAERDGATMAAGQCIVRSGGLTNDDCGNQFCAMEKRALAAEAKLETARRDALTLLNKYAVREEFDYPGDAPASCGFECDECHGTGDTRETVEHEDHCAIRALQQKDTAP